jgi:iron complex outermembrane receptor protein
MVRCRGLCVKAGVVAGLLLGIGNSLTIAQTGALRGKVTDAKTGEALPQANVVVTAPNVATGAAATMSGEYEVKALAAGTYTVSASYIGYDKLVVENVEVKADEVKELNLALEPSLVLLNPTVVSASRREEKALNAPAAISVLEATEIRQAVSPSSQMILANTIGVDMAKTGIDREEIVLRGFNNAFSGACYVLTDYRQAAVASLGVNLHSVMPNVALDLERVEVVRGPGSALYGAGVDAGVIHYITKNPFTYPGTTVSVGGGERGSTYASFRQAGALSDKWGYKITGQYAKADDWQLNPNDPLDAQQLASDRGIKRKYDYLKYNFNGNLEYRLSDRTSLTASGGISSLDATVLSGIGTVQADGFGYTYGQLRLRSGSFFAQTYLNRNNGGDSFVYGSGAKVVENSTLFNAQAQYDFSLSGGKHQIIAGADLDLITPDTEGTIYGRNEDNDQISEYGAYLQSTSAVSSKFDLTLALRGDYNNIQEDFQLSPRVAMVFKPSSDHSFRATYNRAFSSPGNNSNFLDIVAREPDAALPIRIRGRGAADGFTFPHNPAYAALAGTDLVATSLNPAALGQPQPVGLSLAPVYASVYAGLAAIPTATLQAMLAAQGINLPVQTVGALVQLLSPAATTVSGFSRGVLGLLNTTTGSINPVSGVTDIAPLKPTITQSLEAGYKGLINKRILFAVDVYYTHKKDFVGPLLMETPFVLVPNLSADLRAALTTGITNNAQLAGALQAAGIPAATVSQIIVGLAGQNPSFPKATTPVAIVAPNENSLGPGKAPELLLSYRNFGTVDFIGVDASVQISASDRLSFFGNMSWVSDDFFDNEELNEAGTNLSLALNAPKFKAKAGFSYNIPKGFSFNAAGRYSDAFPVRSGPYVGNVEDYFLMDVGAGYDLSKWAPGMSFDVMVQNVLDKEHREFVGAPKLGRLGLARLNYTF